jgi:hypothetical protein
MTDENFTMASYEFDVLSKMKNSRWQVFFFSSISAPDSLDMNSLLKLKQANYTEVHFMVS